MLNVGVQLCIVLHGLIATSIQNPQATMCNKCTQVQCRCVVVVCTVVIIHAHLCCCNFCWCVYVSHECVRPRAGANPDVSAGGEAICLFVQYMCALRVCTVVLSQPHTHTQMKCLYQTTYYHYIP